MKDILDEQLAQNRNAKYFIFKHKSNPESPAIDLALDPQRLRRMVRLGDDVIPEAEFYCEATWLLPGQTPFETGGKPPENVTEAHTHPFGELVGFFGFNYGNIHDLGAEVEFWIDGHPHLIKETFVAFIPPSILHGPLSIRNIVRPVMHLTAGPVKKNR